eukprot:symbB.v1.2.022714.t1/scaffold2026.1/size92022/3
MAKELLSVRLVLDAPPLRVAAALDKALLHGEPGLLKQEQVGLPLPDPISVEWYEFVRQDCKFSLNTIRSGAESVEAFSCSLGLRPLTQHDRITALPLDRFDDAAFRVTLAKRFASHVRVLGRWTSNFDDDRRHGYLVKVDIAPEEDRPIILTQICEVKSTSVGSELTRRILCEGLIHDELRNEEMNDPLIRFLRLHAFMLEIEARAWASCHDLALIEVWRGLRDDYTWALKSAENAVAAYRYGSGHAGPALREVWPLYDASHAQSLSECLAEALQRNLEACPRALLQGALQEGNVYVEAFASVLASCLQLHQFIGSSYVNLS